MGSKKKEAKEKPLEKMTAKELRELAMTIPEITGVHGMNKIELISAIKKVKGIEEVAPKKDTSSVRDLKKKIKKLKAEREKLLENNELEKAAIFRRRIIRLKKRSRRAA